MTKKSDTLTRELRGKHFTRSTEAAPAANLAEVLERAAQAVAQTGHTNGAGEYVHDARHAAFAGTNATISLRSALPDLIDNDGRFTKTPTAVPANETVTIGSAALAGSVCAQAGAHLLEIVDLKPHMGNGAPVLEEVQNKFGVIRPADLHVIDLDASGDGDLTASDLPTAWQTLDRDTLTSRGVRYELTRAQILDRGRDALAGDVLRAIAAGLGRAVDAEILGAIVAASPDSFNAASVAASGLRWGELAAVVGTNGAGVGTPIAAGEIHVQGVPAEISPAVSETVLGAFDRAACFVQPEVDVLVERTRVGGLIITAWTAMQAAVPDTGAFWVAS